MTNDSNKPKGAGKIGDYNYLMTFQEAYFHE
jgi:hypothetical protein